LIIINLHVTVATKGKQKITVEDNAVLPLHTFLHTFFVLRIFILYADLAQNQFLAAF